MTSLPLPCSQLGMALWALQPALNVRMAATVRTMCSPTPDEVFRRVLVRARCCTGWACNCKTVRTCCGVHSLQLVRVGVRGRINVMVRHMLEFGAGLGWSR